MSTPIVLLDIIGRLKTPHMELKAVRAFVFGEQDGLPGFLAVYKASGGQPVLHTVMTITGFERSRLQRQIPHTLTTTEGETWEIWLEGCGCGSPIKRINWSKAHEEGLQQLSLAPAG